MMVFYDKSKDNHAWQFGFAGAFEMVLYPACNVGASCLYRISSAVHMKRRTAQLPPFPYFSVI